MNFELRKSLIPHPAAGALLTYLLMGQVGPVVLDDRFAELTGAQAWAAPLLVRNSNLGIL